MTCMQYGRISVVEHRNNLRQRAERERERKREREREREREERELEEILVQGQCI